MQFSHLKLRPVTSRPWLTPCLAVYSSLEYATYLITHINFGTVYCLQIAITLILDKLISNII